MAKRKHRSDWMLARIREYLSGKESYRQIASTNEISVQSFWRIVKAEMYFLNKSNSSGELRSVIDQYVRFYSYKRFQKRFEVRTPIIESVFP